ncbi:MAG TPA: hypothetical protein VHB79_36970 [Polyangiaceae bacterium]|nr:hypothetical protein [Polyangiaceae bacterium]
MADNYAPLYKALLASATRKLHLGVATAGVGAGVLASVLDLGGSTLPTVVIGLGILAYAAMVGLDVSNPDFIRRANSKLRVDDADAEAWLEPKTLRDSEIREVYSAILRAMDECRRIYGGTGESLRSSLEDGLHRSEQLVLVAARAAKRSDAIRRHLDNDTPESLNKELERLRALASRTNDETAKKSFLQAAEAKAKELETYQQLTGLRDRIHAQLKLIETSLDGLSAKLVKLDASDLTEAISINASITENVQTMTSDVEILESTYEETMQELVS